MIAMIKVIICFVISIAMTTIFISFYWIYVILFLYPIFQIYHNTFNVINKNCFNYKVHFFMFFTQLFFPLSMRFSFFDFFRLIPNKNFIIISTSVMSGLLFFMVLQRFLGRTFYLPKFLNPNYYEYLHKVDTLENQDEKCPICLIELSQSVEETTDANKNLLNKFYMQTPCKHKFHEKCLIYWMDQSLICPNCRTSIPPYN